MTVPATAVAGTSAIVATPTFDITPLLPFDFRKSITIDRTKVGRVPTFDAASTSAGADATTDSWSHTVTSSGANRVLIVGVSYQDAPSSTDVSSVTSNGTNLTKVGTASQSLDVTSQIWRLVNPDTGTHTIQVTLTQAAKQISGAASFLNVHQTTPVGSFFSASGSSTAPSVDVTGVAANELVVDAVGVKTNAAATVGPSQTQRWNAAFSSDTRTAGSTESGTGTVTMSWTLSSAVEWAIGAVALKPAATSPTLSNFPMLFSVTDTDLKSTGNGGDVTSASGHDILFRAVDDTTCGGVGTAPCTLDHEIETYDPATGELVAWVRVPSVNTNAASSDTVLYIYYGNPAIDQNIENVTGVWEVDFEGVWHLHDDFLDSTSNNNDGTNSGSTDAAAQIGDGQDFNGTTDYVDVSGTFPIGSSARTISSWFNTDSFPTGFSEAIFGYRQAPQGTPGEDFILVVEDNAVALGFQGHRVITPKSTLSIDTWYYVSVVVPTGATTTAEVLIYIDGTIQTLSDEAGSSQTLDTPLQ